MRPGDAVMELSRHGFRFRLEGEAVKVRFEGEQSPDPEKVSPLLELLRQHREDVRNFLMCYCPMCGGCCFGTFNGVSVCMDCYYTDLAKVNPGLKTKH
jgi:hypothetical protein